jgi:hypothetical protein
MAIAAASSLKTIAFAKTQFSPEGKSADVSRQLLRRWVHGTHLKYAFFAYHKLAMTKSQVPVKSITYAKVSQRTHHEAHLKSA